MTVLQMLLTGQVDEGMDTHSLKLAQSLLSRAVETLRQERWGQMGEEAIRKYNCQLGQIQQVLNKRHGVDGMTPLA